LFTHQTRQMPWWVTTLARPELMTLARPELIEVEAIAVIDR
jgi:hypothetical protein